MGAYGSFTYAVKGRVELIVAMWMILAAVGAEMGTVAVKYVRGYAIRLLFACTIFIACASVILKQLQLQLASSIMILAAGIAISSSSSSGWSRGPRGAERRTAGGSAGTAV